MANLYKQLKSLLVDEQPRLIGTVVAVHPAAGTSTLETLTGGHVVVIGTAIGVGKRVYYRAGVVEGEAPDLPVYEVEV